MIFAVRQVKEKSIEHWMESFGVFIDLKKVFATVSEEALWFIHVKLGVLENLWI